jgi:small-conductance mechanosensitive channel/CRP-like cAMP-binding protein
VSFWATLATHLWFSPVVLLTYFVTVALVRRTPSVERYHMKVAAVLVLGHLVATGIALMQELQGYEGEAADVTGLAFGLLAVLGMGMTIAFRVSLPRAGIVLPRILLDLFTFAGVFVVLIVIGKRAGWSIAGLITTSAVLTAVIGFSLQDTLGNVMGGLSVQLDKSIRVGDWITLGPGQPQGKVTEIRWRYTAIETRAWDTILIPNGMLVKSQLVIIGRRIGEPLQSRRQIDFYVDFRTPPTDVIEAVESALRRDPIKTMAMTPLPHVLFHGIKDSFAHYCVRYWLTDLDRDDPPDSACRVRVWYALRRANIPLSIPASAIFLTPDTPEREQRKLSDELGRRTHALGSVDLFRGLAQETRDELAAEIVYTPFARGEAVTREGENDDGLYMLVEGECSVRIGKGGEEKEVARLAAGQFFGEMSLMTGEARTASVIAATDMVCYRLDKPAFERILRHTPGLADQIAETLAVRRTALTAVRDEKEEVQQARVQSAKQDLLGRIRGFFGIPSA